MKYCPVPDCKSENPSNAKFCRKCGHPLAQLSFLERIRFQLKESYAHVTVLLNNRNVSEFTLDKFDQISLKPVSTVNVPFFNKLLILIGCVLLLFLILFENIYEFRSLLKEMMGEYNYENLRIIVPFISIPIVIIGIYFIIMCYRKLHFWINAEFIETPTFVGDVCRIAKKCKLGLFDNKSNRILLSSSYDNIEKFDVQHLLLKRNGKCGIYSLTKHSIIIPVEFDSISEFKNSVASAKLGGNTEHYDIKGNHLR